MKFFHLSVRLTNEKPVAFVFPFDKPIKSLYFRSFVISVLFARFHFKVIRKSLYYFVVVLVLLFSLLLFSSIYNSRTENYEIVIINIFVKQIQEAKLVTYLSLHCFMVKFCEVV